MDKSNFKKLALMGMAGGLLLSQAPVCADIQNVESNVNVAHSGCGSSCASKRNYRQAPRTYGGNTADAYDSSANSGMYDQSSSSTMNQGSQNMSGNQVTESQLLPQLNSEGKALYYGLDPEFKEMALRQAGSGRFSNMNDAVKEAAKRQADKRHGVNSSGRQY